MEFIKLLNKFVGEKDSIIEGLRFLWCIPDEGIFVSNGFCMVRYPYPVKVMQLINISHTSFHKNDVYLVRPNNDNIREYDVLNNDGDTLDTFHLSPDFTKAYEYYDNFPTQRESIIDTVNMYKKVYPKSDNTLISYGGIFYNRKVFKNIISLFKKLGEKNVKVLFKKDQNRLDYMQFVGQNAQVILMSLGSVEYAQLPYDVIEE
jgi:hypothetical protein